MLMRQMEYLCALAREEHFGRAATTCHVSQPALSAGIRNLETELGVQVVLRGQRFKGFTPEGRHVLRWAQRTLAERHALDQEIANMRGGLSGRLRIGAIPTALSVSSLLTAPVRGEHPLVTFSLESMSSRQIADRLNDFDIDVGMTYVDGEPLGRVRVLPLYRERYLFLTPRHGDYGTPERLTWAEAATAPLSLLMPLMQNRRILDGHFADAGAEARPVLETDTVSAIYDHVASLGLSSVIPHTWLYGFGIPEGARVVPLPSPQRALHVGLVLAAGDRESLLARAFVETARGVDLPRLLDATLAEHGIDADGHSRPRDKRRR